MPRSHVHKTKGRKVEVYILKRSGGVQRYSVREKTLRENYRRVYASGTAKETGLGVRKGTSYYIRQRRVLEVMVYGLARDAFDAGRYAFLDEKEWVFYFKPKTDPKRVTDIILQRFEARRIKVIDTHAKNAEEAYRPFTIASQVVDDLGSPLTTLTELPEKVDKLIDELDWVER